MRPPLVKLARDNKAASAAEFALVLPLFLLFLLGMIDVGRLMWTWNRAEKATQMGVRYAVVTDFVADSIGSFNFSGDGNGTQGDAVNTAVFTGISCTSASCSCTGTACSSIGASLNTTAFNDLVNLHMKPFLPDIDPSDVKIDYTNVGLGYAGDPNGPDVAPLVTVSLKPNSVSFTPLFLFNQVDIKLPSFSAALTMEDGQGNVSN